MTTIETALRRVYGPLALSLKRRGIRATLSDAVHRRLDTGSPRRAHVSDGYDALYGVDTAGSIPLSDLDIKGPNWIFGTVYEATNARRFQELMAFAPEDLASYSFVDFGSGKGKALLLAAHQVQYEQLVVAVTTGDIRQRLAVGRDARAGIEASGKSDALDLGAVRIHTINLRAATSVASEVYALAV